MGSGASDGDEKVGTVTGGAGVASNSSGDGSADSLMTNPRIGEEPGGMAVGAGVTWGAGGAGAGDGTNAANALGLAKN